jgi:hypothetical protein
MAERTRRAWRLTLLATTLLISGCRVLDLLGISHPIKDEIPQFLPCNYTGYDEPCLIPTLNDTVLAVGDTETVTPNIEWTPIRFFSRPIGTLDDSLHTFVSYDTGVVRLDGYRLTALKPGTDSLVMTGWYNHYYPLRAKIFITVLQTR